jgi:hypothetical protein
MIIIQTVIGVGLIGMLWRIATELSHIQTSIKFMLDDIRDLSDRVRNLENRE